MAFSANHSLYLPWKPWQWRAYPTDNGEPWWVDCSQMTCADLLSTSTNLCATLEMHGVTVTSVVLIKNILTGETLLYPGCSTDAVASIAAPSGYEPGTQLGENAWVWREWQQITNCLDCWGLTADEIPPPIVTLKTRLADASLYPTYSSNLEVEAAASASEDSEGGFTAMAGGGMMMSFYDPSCIVTDTAEPFAITAISQNTNAWTLVTYESCTAFVYIVFSADTLSNQTVWQGRTAVRGQATSTTYTDTTTPGVTNRFYRIQRIPADEGYNGDAIPSGWVVDHGLNLLDPDLDSEDPDGDCLNNLQEYLQGSDPLVSSPILIEGGTVYAGSTTNTFSVVPNLLPLYSFGGGSPVGIIQSSIDSNFYGTAETNGTQIIFKMTPGGAVTTLYSFATVANGYYPSVPVQGTDSNFYGVCYLGGKTNPSVCNDSVIGYGTVFKLTPQGVLTNLHLFAGPPEGSAPVGGVVQGLDGSLYGVTEVGGSNNCLDSYCCDNGYGGYGTVFKLTPQGTLTTLHTFSGGADGAFPEAALLQGSGGYLYGTTSAGNGNAGTVFKISTNGTNFATLHPFTGGTDGATPLGALVQDSSGILYGTAYGAGTNGFGTVFKVDTNGASFVTLHPFGGIPDGSYPGAGLVQSSSGIFYGTTGFGGSSGGGIGAGDGTVFTITSQGTLTTVYQFNGGAEGGNPRSSPLVQGIFDGDFYGTTLNGGANGEGILFKYTPATYAWTISGGTFAYGQSSPYVGFTTASACPITLSVVGTNSLGCTNSGSITVTPTAPFPTANTPIPAGQTLNLSVPTVSGATYSWTGPNGFASTNQNPSITNVPPCGVGQYCVSVLGAGCTSMPNCVSVTINTPQPTSSSPLCAGQTLALSVTNVTGVTYSWTGPAGFASTLQNPSILNAQPSNSGQYCVVTVAGVCTSTPNCVSVTIYPLPTAVVSNTTSIVCQGSGATILATLTGTSPWIVNWSDGIIDSNITINPCQHGVTPYHTTNYTVVAVSDAHHCTGGSVSGSATVTVTTNVTSTVVVSNEVLVIYNSNIADSFSCENYYINHRPGFSNANVLACSCTTTGTDGFETITTANLTNQIINPIINFIQSNTNKSIHYVVLMYGMPSRVDDDSCNSTALEPPSVQHHISRCMSDAGYTSGSYYEGSTCPFVATNYLGTTCLVTALNMGTLSDCTAYIDKVTSMYTGNVIISAKGAGYSNNTYYVDDTGGTGYAKQFAAALLAQNPSASVTYSSSSVIANGSNVKGYIGWGIHNGVFANTYAVDGSVVWSGSSKWWLIETFESFNGQRCCPQGCAERWFASNAWGGTNYTNTPVGAVSHVQEPGLGGVNSPSYMTLWEEGFLFSECAWASKITPCFQAVGDPLVKQ